MIVVVGGGLAGLATGAALGRAGFEVRVVERSERLEDFQAGLILGANALRMLNAIGLAEPVAGQGAALRATRIEKANGRLVAAADLSDFPERYGHPSIALHRRGLVEVLAAALPKNTLRLGVRVVDFEDSNDGVGVTLEDGERISASALVGADGVHSDLRRKLVGELPIGSAGYASWRGIVGGVPGLEPGVLVERWGPGCRFAFAPLGVGAVMVYASDNAPRSLGDDPRAQLQRFRHFAPPVPELVEALLSANRFERADVLEVAPLPRWTWGRATLLGDAAHAMTPSLPQGASQSIEDAVVLAASLASCRDDLPAGLQAYEAARRPRATEIAERSRSLGELAHWRHPIARTVRDTFLAWAPGALLQSGFDSLYGVAVPEAFSESARAEAELSP